MAEVKNKRVSFLIEEEPAWIPSKEEFAWKAELPKDATQTSESYTEIILIGATNTTGSKIEEQSRLASQIESAGSGTVVLRNATGNIRVGDPTTGAHASNKRYVDSHISGITAPSIPSVSGSYHLELNVDTSTTPATVALEWVANE